MRHVGDGFQWISSGSCCWCWCWPSNRRQKGWRTSWDINTNNRLAGIPCPRHFTKFMAIGRKEERRTKASSATKGYLCHRVEYNQHAAASGPRRGRTRDTYLPIPLLDEETSNPQYSAFNFRLLPVSLYPTFHLKPSTNSHKIKHFHIPCLRESFSKDNLKFCRSTEA